MGTRRPASPLTAFSKCDIDCSGLPPSAQVSGSAGGQPSNPDACDQGATATATGSPGRFDLPGPKVVGLPDVLLPDALRWLLAPPQCVTGRSCVDLPTVRSSEVSSPSRPGRHRTLGAHNVHFGVDQKAVFYNQNPTISTGLCASGLRDRMRYAIQNGRTDYGLGLPHYGDEDRNSFL